MRNFTANGFVGELTKIINHQGHEGTRRLGSHISYLQKISQWNRECGEGYNATVPESRQVVVYSRKGCHLCELVKESLAKLSHHGGFIWHEVDVDSDTELRRQFTDEVPVVFIDGRKAFKYKMDEREFLRRLAS
jgi:glutaredoxin